VVIGASAGALEALSAILPTLRADFGLPILVVVHVPPNRSSMLAELFRAKCRHPVREAEDKDHIDAGTIHFAPPDYHLLVETTGSVALSRCCSRDLRSTFSSKARRMPMEQRRSQ